MKILKRLAGRRLKRCTLPPQVWTTGSRSRDFGCWEPKLSETGESSGISGLNNCNPRIGKELNQKFDVDYSQDKGDWVHCASDSEPTHAHLWQEGNYIRRLQSRKFVRIQIGDGSIQFQSQYSVPSLLPWVGIGYIWYVQILTTGRQGMSWLETFAFPHPIPFPIPLFSRECQIPSSSSAVSILLLYVW